MSARDDAIRVLRRARPRDRFARGSAAALAALTAWAWLGGTFRLGELVGERSLRNLARFLGEIRPWPLHGRPWDWSTYAVWLRDTFAMDAPEALLSTVALSVAAIGLAALGAAALAAPATRTLVEVEAWVPGPRPPGRAARFVAGSLVGVTRLGLIFLRAVPEYVWAFLLLALLGGGPWPAVLALGVHNAGILGKLAAEVGENADAAAPRTLRAIGGGRAQVAVCALVPGGLGRFLLYFFYRWETCVREATVLGLLGLVSLGWYVQEARAGARLDEMVHWVAAGALLILAGDVVSGVARRWLRESS